MPEVIYNWLTDLYNNTLPFHFTDEQGKDILQPPDDASQSEKEIFTKMVALIKILCDPIPQNRMSAEEASKKIEEIQNEYALLQLNILISDIEMRIWDIDEFKPSSAFIINQLQLQSLRDTLTKEKNKLIEFTKNSSLDIFVQCEQSKTNILKVATEIQKNNDRFSPQVKRAIYNFFVPNTKYEEGAKLLSSIQKAMIKIPILVTPKEFIQTIKSTKPKQTSFSPKPKKPPSTKNKPKIPPPKNIKKKSPNNNHKNKKADNNKKDFFFSA